MIQVTEQHKLKNAVQKGYVTIEKLTNWLAMALEGIIKQFLLNYYSVANPRLKWVIVDVLQ
jgi:hypothetical protein